MSRKVLCVLAGVALAFTAVSAEQTVGLFINEPGAFDGYTLFTCGSWPVVYLINNDGEIVHTWQDSVMYTANNLAPDGYLYRCPRIPGSTGFNCVQKVDWDDQIVWHFDYKGDSIEPHHDIEVLPNGNILILSRELINPARCIAAGADPSLLLNGTIFADYIVEVKPEGDGGVIVWEWHAWDHIIQEYDPTKANYGVVADHPELLHVNAGLPKFQWPHLNWVNYNAKLDQLILTSFVSSEFMLIDHSTTSAEARGHTGGRSGKGGDILYRWGNPENYNQGTHADRKLFAVHDGNVVPDGAPNAGSYTMFNNGVSRTFTSIERITPPMDSSGNYVRTGPRWGPEIADWTYTDPNPDDFYSPMNGCCQPLPNGNVLVSSALQGTIFEVTPDKRMVWRYVSPVSDKGPVRQGDKVTNNNTTHVRRFAPDYPAFAGRDLTPRGPIELAVHEDAAPLHPLELKLEPSVAGRPAVVAYALPGAGPVRVRVYNALGQGVRLLVDETQGAGRHRAVWDGRDDSGASVRPGIYFCRLTSAGQAQTDKLTLIR